MSVPGRCLFTLWDTAAHQSEHGLFQGHGFPRVPDSASAPSAQGTREPRWRHKEHLLFECLAFSCRGSSVAMALLWNDLSRACAGFSPAEIMLLAAFLCDRTPLWLQRLVLARSSMPLLPPLASIPLGHMKPQCLDHVTAFLLGVSCAVCSRQPTSASVLLPRPPSSRRCSQCGTIIYLGAVASV